MSLKLRSCNVDAAVVRNMDVLAIVAEFLGIQSSTLESALSYKAKLVKKELCSIFLDSDGASDNRDDHLILLRSASFSSHSVSFVPQSIILSLCSASSTP